MIYHSHTNRHPDLDGQPWGWLTASPDWRAPAVAYWSGWTGPAAKAVATGGSRAGLDVRAPWSVRQSPKRMSWDAPEWHVVNADGVTVLKHIKTRDLADAFAAAAQEPA